MDQHLTARIPEANTFVTLGVAKITTNLHQSVSALVSIDYMVKRLKFSADMKYSRLMGELLALKISEGCSTWPDCLLPVPLHHSRLLERGYNQAFQIADIVSKRLCIPVEQDCASRITSQASQVQLNARDRTKNLRSAFSVTTRVTDKKIAIIDDVYTTGATTRSLAMTLKKAGASSVSIWAFARTP